jgi:hypothetical protein
MNVPPPRDPQTSPKISPAVAVAIAPSLLASFALALPSLAAEIDPSGAAPLVDPSAIIWALGGLVLGAIGTVAATANSNPEQSGPSMGNVDSDKAVPRKEDLNDLEKTILELRERERQLETEIAAVKKEQTAPEAAAAQDKAGAKDPDEDLQRLQAQASTARTLAATLESELAAKSGVVQELRREIARLNQAVLVSSKAEDKSAQQKIKALEEQLRGAQELVSEKETKVAAQQDQLVRGRMEREKLKARMIEADRALTAAKESKQAAAAAENMVATLQHQLESRDTLLEASYQDQNEMMARLEDAAAKAATAEEGKRALQEELVTMERSLEAARQHTEVANAQAREEKLGRLAAEKALGSLEAQHAQLLAVVKAAEEDRERLEADLKIEHRKLEEELEDAKLATKDAKEALHREMEAVAELQRQSELVKKLQTDLVIAKREATEAREALVAAQAASSQPEKKRRGRPRKKPAEDQAIAHDDHVETKDDEAISLSPLPSATSKDDRDGNASASAFAEANAPSTEDSNYISEEEMRRRLKEADDAAAAARALAEEAKQRSFEIRAEAALLVETVEDRAVEAIEEAAAEVERLKAELARVSNGGGGGSSSSSE